MKKSQKYIVFISSLIAIFFILKLDNYITLRPQSIHIWRQTDCLAITQNYFQKGNSFGEPEIYNQISDGGFSGKSAGELPLLYYSVSVLWKIFGKHEWIYRAFVFLIFVIGCLSLFKLTLNYTKNYFLSVFLSLLLFASPTIANYSINFLPNIPALGLVMIAWLFIYHYYKTGRDLFFWIASMIFALAILLKVTAGISFVSLVGWWFIETFFVKNGSKLFKKGLMDVFPFIFSMALVFAWYWYAKEFNSIHGGKYTFNNVWPIWGLSGEKIANTFDLIDKIWLKEYFHPYFLILTGVVWLFLLTQIKKIKAFLYYLLLVFPLGSILYLLLWFRALDGHDYYLINILFLITIVWGVFFFTFYNKRWLGNKVSGLVLVGVLVLLLFNSSKRLENRFGGWMNDLYTTRFEAVGELDPIFDTIGVEKNDKVISIPDYTINGTLYYMNRQGFTDFGSDFSKEETFHQRIKQGARYLVVNDSLLLAKEVLQPFIKDKVGENRNVSIYRLPEY